MAEDRDLQDAREKDAVIFHKYHKRKPPLSC